MVSRHHRQRSRRRARRSAGEGATFAPHEELKPAPNRSMRIQEEEVSFDKIVVENRVNILEMRSMRCRPVQSAHAGGTRPRRVRCRIRPCGDRLVCAVPLPMRRAKTAAIVARKRHLSLQPAVEHPCVNAELDLDVGARSARRSRPTRVENLERVSCQFDTVSTQQAPGVLRPKTRGHVAQENRT